MPWRRGLSCGIASDAAGLTEKPDYATGVELATRAVTYQFAETFVISRDSGDESESVVVELRHAGETGFGEGTPIDRYEEDADAAAEFLNDCGELLGDDPFALDEILAALPAAPHTQAARAALDHALHDLCGKLTGLPVWRLLGLRREGPPTCWTVWLGDPDDMARRAEGAAPRFRRLKLKLGGRDGLDVERVRAVRSVTDVPLQVDVNEYWSVDEALEALPQLAGLGVEAGAQIASLCDFVDLDGNLLLLDDPWPGVEFRDGVQFAPNKPGLGVEPVLSTSAERSDGRN